MARWVGTVVLGVTLAMVLGAAQAQETKKGKLDADAVFNKLDANGDGKLEKLEFLKLADQFKDKVKAREKLTAVYEQIDPGNQGLSKGLFRTYMEKKKKKS